ncbi:MAG TPA: ABC transporter substrate-binding protein [Candidatus Binatia bacterium]|jgi:NitT/TauT family transport system substrate-binding protein
MRRALWVLLTLALLVHPGFAQEKSLTLVSYPPRPPKLPLWLARDARLFKKYGVDVALKEPASSEALLAALARRDADMYAATAPYIVSAIGDGAALVFIANTGYSVLKLLTRPEITAPQQLKGKRVGTGDLGSSQDRITHQALRRVGLDPERDVTLVPIGGRSVERLKALIAGKIDATTSNEDNLFELERRGEMDKVRVLADNESLKLYIGAGVDFAVSRTVLQRDRATVKNFLKAMCEATALARRDRAAADRIFTQYIGVRDPALLDFMYRTYVLGAIPQKPFPKAEAVGLGLEEFGTKPGVKGKKAEDLIDASLVRELEQEGFFQHLYSK